jgi:signal transduction histidine kinase
MNNIGAHKKGLTQISKRQPPTNARRGLSIELKLPIAFCLLVVFLVSVYVIASYREVQLTAREAANERVTLVSADLADLIGMFGNTRVSQINRQLATPGVVSALTGGPTDAAAPVLRSVRLPGDTTLTIMLVDAGRRPLLQDGDSLSPGARAALGRALRDAGELERPFVQFQFFVENGRPLFWSIYRVPDTGPKLGHLAYLRALGRPITLDALKRLIGSQNHVLLANANDPVGPWFRLDGSSVQPAAEFQSDGGTQEYTRADTTFIARATLIPNSPWMLIVETPEAATHTRALQFLERTGALGFLLVLLGTTLAWLVSRRFTRPMRELSRSANAIAEGRYDQPVDTRRTDELGAVAQAFNHMSAAVQQAVSDAEHSRAEAELANRVKSEFLATMSHEIRTPINAMLGYAELLELGISGPVTPEQRAQLARIRLSGQHLSGLINDLLDFARLETGRLTIRSEVSAAEPVIQTALTVIEPPASAKGIDLHVEADAEVSFSGDPKRVEQILVNLLDNAVKFTPDKGSVTLRVHTVERSGSARTRFVVEDTGVGISPEQIETMFEAFVQGESGLTRSHGGSGLGLTISRRLARLMGGEITVESEPGKGARFVLELPAPAEKLIGTT